MSPDMSIESVLSDPMIRAVMRADRVEPQVFERLLRSAASTLDRVSATRVPAVLTAKPPRAAFWGYCCA